MTLVHGRIAYLCLEAPREGQASYVHVNEIIAGLERRGWKVDLWSPRNGDQWERPHLVWRVLGYFRLQTGLVAALGSYDIIYVRAHPFAVVAALIACLRGIPVVQECNGTYGDMFVAHPAARKVSSWLIALQRWQYRSAKALIAVTPQLKSWLEEQVAPRQSRIVVIANGANIDLFHPNAFAQHEPLDLPKRYVVFFGGLTRWHGVPEMIAALAAPGWPPDVSLVVVGDGPEAPALKERAMIDSKLVLLGRRPYAEVPEVVAGAIAGLVPISDPQGRSSSAGMAPLKLYETLASGCPAVVSNLPGQSDLVRRHECGLCFEVGDAHGLAAAVARLAADPEAARAMGTRGRAAVVAEHSWDRRAEDTGILLHDVMASSDPST